MFRVHGFHNNSNLEAPDLTRDPSPSWGLEVHEDRSMRRCPIAGIAQQRSDHEQVSGSRITLNSIPFPFHGPFPFPFISPLHGDPIPEPHFV